jgi:hypothetical protein
MRYEGETSRPVSQAILRRIAVKAVNDIGFSSGLLEVVSHEGDESDASSGKHVLYLSTKDGTGNIRVEIELSTSTIVSVQSVK